MATNDYEFTSDTMQPEAVETYPSYGPVTSKGGKGKGNGLAPSEDSPDVNSTNVSNDTFTSTSSNQFVEVNATQEDISDFYSQTRSAPPTITIPPKAQNIVVPPKAPMPNYNPFTPQVQAGLPSTSSNLPSTTPSWVPTLERNIPLLATAPSTTPLDQRQVLPPSHVQQVLPGTLPENFKCGSNCSID